MPSPAATVAPVIERIRSIQARWSSTLALGRDLRDGAAQRGEVERGARRHPRHDHARHRQVLERQAAAEPRLQQACGFLLA